MGWLTRRGNSSLQHDKGSVYRALAIFHIGTFFKQLCPNGPIFTRPLISQNWQPTRIHRQGPFSLIPYNTPHSPPIHNTLSGVWSFET